MRARAVILAGGEGSRLGVLTEKRAKPAVPFAGKYRIIDFTLSNCVNSGISDVMILTQYRPHSLNEHIASGRPWDLDRTFSGGVQIYQPFRGRFVDRFQRHLYLRRDLFAGLELRRSLNDLAIEPPELDLHLSILGCHIQKLALQFPSVGGVPANAERTRLTQHQLGEFVGIGFGAKHGQQHARPALFHLDGRIEDIQRARRERLFDKVAEYF
jgi:hypothetical protein